VPFVLDRLDPHRRRTPASEAKTQLKYLYTVERSYFLEHDVYDDDMARIEFLPVERTRYTYFTAATGRVLPPITARPTPAPGPFQIAAADPTRSTYRGTFTTFADTGCTVTPVILSTGRAAGLGVTPADGTHGPVFIGAAATNLDDDATIDCWSIATEERTAADGERIPAGVPHNEVNDLVR
jgi:type IV pilus assembly protein PilA